MKLLVRLLFVCWLAFPVIVQAQAQTILRLETASTALQTGQEYEIAIHVDDAPDFWTTDIALGYEPALLYVMGTRAGSPVQLGELYPPESSVTVQNAVQNNQVSFVISKVGETSPASGSGVIGRFRIFPIAPGTTQITFSRANLVGLTSYDANATNVGTVPVEAVPVLLELTITGDPVAPPSEATATPSPTDTPTPFAPIAGQVNEQATVENLAQAPVAAPQTDSQPPIVPILIGVMVVSALVLIVLFVLWRRRRA